MPGLPEAPAAAISMTAPYAAVRRVNLSWSERVVDMVVCSSEAVMVTADEAVMVAAEAVVVAVAAVVAAVPEVGRAVPRGG
ncbi:hypothetical protein GCM10010349_08980 [Streptomyces flavofungini]|nr:hypothetical protein GCM10010349_08980 [Streptomyces flavofungini]